MISGQMGHPAACMMESKSELQACAVVLLGAGRSADYVSGVGRYLRQLYNSPTLAPHEEPMSCTDSVDNFVKNPAGSPCEPAVSLALARTISKQAVQNAFESMRYQSKPARTGLSRQTTSIHAVCGHFCVGDARG
jgi:hypothetical protein